MIELLFYFGGDIVMITIRGNHITFRNSIYGMQEATIEGLKLDYSGVIREFPDLKDNPNWHTEAINRFKDKIKNMKSEEEISDYITEDLRKFGYRPKWKQRAGFRKEAIK